MLKENDNSLVTRCLSNDRAAQKQLYDTFAPSMYALIKRYVDNLDEANDILQEGFIAVFKYLGGFKFESSLRHWIKKIIIHTIYRNRKKKWNNSVNLEDPLAMTDTPIHLQLDQTMDMKYVMTIIDELPKGLKEVFNMFFIDDMSHREISKILNISEVSSRTRIFKSREILQGKLLKAGIYQK